LPMTASFSRRRRCNRSNEAAIAGVILRPNRIGNSEGGEFRFSASAEVPLPPGETPGGGGEGPAGASICRAVAGAALMSCCRINALAQAFLDMALMAIGRPVVGPDEPSQPAAPQPPPSTNARG